jgi:hypothetical protein
MKFGTEDNLMPMSNCEFGENQCDEGHTLPEGINELLPMFFTFLFQFLYNSL